MKLWIQPCSNCADLHGRTATTGAHEHLAKVSTNMNNDVVLEEHYTCKRCDSEFTRIMSGEPRMQVWMLLNAGQH